MLRSGEAIAELVGSGYRIVQSLRGYRYSLEAVLLASFASSFPARWALELGMGNGAASLLLARKRDALKILGIEIQESLASQAWRSISLNDLQDRVFVLVADWKDARHLLPGGFFDLVFSNPPFRERGSGRVSPRRELAIARHASRQALEELIRSASWVLKAKGVFALIHRVEPLADLLSSLCRARLEPKWLRPVQSFPQGAAELVLVGARKEGRRGLQILPPLALYSSSREGYSPELQAIYDSFKPARAEVP